jgi:hypothetical protein
MSDFLNIINLAILVIHICKFCLNQSLGVAARAVYPRVPDVSLVVEIHRARRRHDLVPLELSGDCTLPHLVDGSDTVGSKPPAPLFVFEASVFKTLHRA